MRPPTDPDDRLAWEYRQTERLLRVVLVLYGLICYLGGFVLALMESILVALVLSILVTVTTGGVPAGFAESVIIGTWMASVVRIMPMAHRHGFEAWRRAADRTPILKRTSRDDHNHDAP